MSMKAHPLMDLFIDSDCIGKRFMPNYRQRPANLLHSIDRALKATVRKYLYVWFLGIN
jgi:hypothetical protein